MHFTVWRIVILVSLIVLACGCFVFYHFVPQMVKMVAKDQLPLVEGSPSTKQYKRLPVPITQNIYIFNITNYNEFMNNKELPSVEQLGPYAFSSIWEKDMSWDGDQLFFFENRTFYFLPDLSNGTLDDEVYTVDIVLVGIIQIINKMPKLLQAILRPLLRLRPILCQHKVREFLYEGYDDLLAKIGKIFEPNLPVIDGKVGFLLGKNGSNDGMYSVFSGNNGHLDKTNMITSLANSSTISYYKEPCNKFSGTNGEIYPPLEDGQQSIDVFNPMFCRPWSLYLNGSETVRGVTSSIFSSGDVIFSSTGNATLDSCYEKNPGLRGTFDASACQYNQPILFSLPHFYKGDEELRKQVHGMHPDPEKHDFSLNVFSFGITTDFKIRLQVNIANITADPSRPGTTPTVTYPVLWQELILLPDDRDKLNDVLWGQAVRPKVIIEGVSIALGSLLLASFIIVIIVFYLIDRKRCKQCDEEPFVQHDEAN